MRGCAESTGALRGGAPAAAVAEGWGRRAGPEPAVRKAACGPEASNAPCVPGTLEPNAAVAPSP